MKMMMKASVSIARKAARELACGNSIRAKPPSRNASAVFGAILPGVGLGSDSQA